MAFLEDPRLRQRWNQITHDAEAATENAAAGIWSFQHNYINPCFGSIASSLEQCTTVCLGDPEERLRRRRERERARAEYSFDFYDDWYEEEANAGGSGGLFGTWGNEDWDRLLAGTGSQRKHPGETTEQPRRKRGMSYGTRGGRRKASSDQDPTIIPSTHSIGFLSKLPWKMGATLRYKPSAADLQDHPKKAGDGEAAPLLESDEESDFGEIIVQRKRSGTTGSGDTSDSYRSRGDLFPSDGEGEEDAVPLDGEVTYDMLRKDDRRRSRSSKGKGPAGFFSRTVSRTTIGSTTSGESPLAGRRSTSTPNTPAVEVPPSLQDLEMEEDRLRTEEDEEVARKKEAARALAAQKGLGGESSLIMGTKEVKPEIADEESYTPPAPEAPSIGSEPNDDLAGSGPNTAVQATKKDEAEHKDTFVPARLPFF
ncbi:hypothetical protein NLU13_9616 [Sarocladium strictum]|uniref:Uncharacterized protein n=1 Tax=Sarocladium strictum TaxID=5046 RepID=A0AA39L4J2_SARSR|nr:hypothetical protein NLU13_9616 [Sarocladium strictum]